MTNKPKYAVAPNGILLYTVDGDINVAWDSTHLNPVNKLTNEERALFGVSPILLTDPPAINPVTHYVEEDTPTLIDGVWTQQWSVVPFDAPTVAVRLQEAQDLVWKKIQLHRNNLKSGGTKVDNKWFHSDVDSRIQQLGLVMMGANVPLVQWKTLDGTFVPMTQTLANQIFTATATLDMNLFSVAETHRAAMMQVANPNEYDYSGGWPETFVPE